MDEIELYERKIHGYGGFEIEIIGDIFQVRLEGWAEKISAEVVLKSDGLNVHEMRAIARFLISECDKMEAIQTNGLSKV